MMLRRTRLPWSLDKMLHVATMKPGVGAARVDYIEMDGRNPLYHISLYQVRETAGLERLRSWCHHR